jgi:diguanylate cyclase (GGDEF)-like protein
MDYQNFVNQVAMPCCVISVDKAGDDAYGDIRIIAANAAYKAVMGLAYYDGMLYSELVPQDNKFEDFCYRAAILKKRMHAYVETRALSVWTDQTLIPLESDREDRGCCQFVFEFTREADPERMSSVSAASAKAAIRASLTLLNPADFKTNVREVLKVILDEAEAKAAQILLIDRENRRAVDFCRILSADARPVFKNGVDTIGYELLDSWERMIGMSNDVIIQNEQDYALIERENPAWAESLRMNRVENLVLIPLRRGKDVVGYLYALNFNTAKVVQVKELMEIMSVVLGAEIYNHRLLQRLETLSQVDALTGLGNRRAMKKRIEFLSERNNAPFGVINIDLNGLKVTNDRKGHEAGDKLLVQAGEILRKVFYQEDLFRTGGDEFIVLIDGISRDTFYIKLDRLRGDMMKNASVSFAIGECWSDGSTDIKTAFDIADERMYADKQAFYQRYPELRRE